MAAAYSRKQVGLIDNWLRNIKDVYKSKWVVRMERVTGMITQSLTSPSLIGSEWGGCEQRARWNPTTTQTGGMQHNPFGPECVLLDNRTRRLETRPETYCACLGPWYCRRVRKWRHGLMMIDWLTFLIHYIYSMARKLDFQASRPSDMESIYVSRFD